MCLRVKIKLRHSLPESSARTGKAIVIQNSRPQILNFCNSVHNLFAVTPSGVEGLRVPSVQNSKIRSKKPQHIVEALFNKCNCKLNDIDQIQYIKSTISQRILYSINFLKKFNKQQV